MSSSLFIAEALLRSNQLSLCNCSYLRVCSVLFCTLLSICIKYSLYCNRWILQESRRIFTNNYKQYVVPWFKNLYVDKKLKEILNTHRNAAKFVNLLKMCVIQYEYLIMSCEVIWITIIYLLISVKLIYFIMYMVLTWCIIR